MFQSLYILVAVTLSWFVFQRALEVLEKFAELRDSEQDYSRALAFRLSVLLACLVSATQ